MSIDTEDLEGQLLRMGVGSVARIGSVKIMRSERASWLVAASGVAKEFSVVAFAARWIALLAEDEAGF